MQEEVARLNFEGKLQTAVEQKGETRQRLHFPGVDAVVSYGRPIRDGERPPGTTNASGRVLVAQLGPLEFLVTGFEASVSFELPKADSSKEQLEILCAEEGQYSAGTWTMSRIWNGDQTDRGLQFRAGNAEAIRIRLHRLPLRAGNAGSAGQ